MEELTQQQINLVVVCQGRICPYCKSQQLDDSTFRRNGENVTVEVNCATCAKTFLLCYGLVSAMEKR